MRNECLEQVKTCPWPHVLHMVKQSPSPETPTPEPSSILGPFGDGAGKFLGALGGPGGWVSAPRPTPVLVFPTWGWLLRWRMVGISFSSLFSSVCLRVLVQADVLLLCREIDRPWRNQVAFCDSLLSVPTRMSLLLLLFLPTLPGLLMKPAPLW